MLPPIDYSLWDQIAIKNEKGRIKHHRPWSITPRSAKQFAMTGWWRTDMKRGDIYLVFLDPTQSRSLPLDIVSNLVSGFKKASLTVPVGPFLCLPIMISATPGSFESLK